MVGSKLVVGEARGEYITSLGSAATFGGAARRPVPIGRYPGDVRGIRADHWLARRGLKYCMKQRYIVNKDMKDMIMMCWWIDTS